jgi:hypothetical protein
LGTAARARGGKAVAAVPVKARDVRNDLLFMETDSFGLFISL